MPGPGFIDGKPWFKNGLPVFGSGQGCGEPVTNCPPGYTAAFDVENLANCEVRLTDASDKPFNDNIIERRWFEGIVNNPDSVNANLIGINEEITHQFTFAGLHYITLFIWTELGALCRSTQTVYCCNDFQVKMTELCPVIPGGPSLETTVEIEFIFQNGQIQPAQIIEFDIGGPGTHTQPGGGFVEINYEVAGTYTVYLLAEVSFAGVVCQSSATVTVTVPHKLLCCGNLAPDYPDERIYPRIIYGRYSQTNFEDRGGGLCPAIMTTPWAHPLNTSFGAYNYGSLRPHDCNPSLFGINAYYSRGLSLYGVNVSSPWCPETNPSSATVRWGMALIADFVPSGEVQLNYFSDPFPLAELKKRQVLNFVDFGIPESQVTGAPFGPYIIEPDV